MSLIWGHDSLLRDLSKYILGNFKRMKWWMTIIQCCGCMVKMAYFTCLHFSMFFFRCREKQRKEASRLQTVNRKLSAMNKLLMEENDRLQKQVSQLVYDNGYMKQQIHTVSNFLWVIALLNYNSECSLEYHSMYNKCCLKNLISWILNRHLLLLLTIAVSLW